MLNLPQSRWEIDLDGVYFDGVRLPDSTIPSANPVADSTRNSALIDTVRMIAQFFSAHFIDFDTREIQLTEVLKML